MRRVGAFLVLSIGLGTRANLNGPKPAAKSFPHDRYVLGQLTRTLTKIDLMSNASRGRTRTLAAYSACVARNNRWVEPDRNATRYPPFRHVIYIIKENRTYDQVLGDLPEGNGDNALVFFPRPVSHACDTGDTRRLNRDSRHHIP